MTLIVSNQDVEAVLNMKECMDVLEEAYREAGLGRAVDGPVLRILTPRTEDEVPGASQPIYHGYSSCPASILKWNVACNRIDSDFIHYPFVDGLQRQVRLPGEPSKRFCGYINLYSTLTGEPLAIIHDGYVQKLRVGATAGLGTKYLAKQDARVLGLIGSGWQASAAIQAHCLARTFELVKVYSPTKSNRERFAEEWSETLQVQVQAVDTSEEAVRGSDVINIATNALSPVIQTDWIEPGMVIVPVKDSNELERSSWERADLLVSTIRGRQWAYYGVGGLAGFPEQGKDYWGRIPSIDWDEVSMLGDIVAGDQPGRTSDDQVVILLNRGHGIQFAAAGHKIYQAAKAKNLGKEIPTEYYLQDPEYIP